MSDISLEIEHLAHDFVVRIVAAAQAQTLDRVLAAVGASFGRIQASLPAGRNQKAARPVASTPRRKLKLGRAALATRKLQGRYLSVIRPLQPAARERVKKVAHEKGVAEAIKFAATLT